MHLTPVRDLAHEVFTLLADAMRIDNPDATLETGPPRGDRFIRAGGVEPGNHRSNGGIQTHRTPARTPAGRGPRIEPLSGAPIYRKSALEPSGAPAYTTLATTLLRAIGACLRLFGIGHICGAFFVTRSRRLGRRSRRCFNRLQLPLALRFLSLLLCEVSLAFRKRVIGFGQGLLVRGGKDHRVREVANYRSNRPANAAIGGDRPPWRR
ncbi:MAG: hypothetical protein ACM3JC_04935 [Rudaea sp.]